MADFVAVLKKTIDGLDEANPEVRRKVYDKARTTIAAKLNQINPPPPAAVAERQKKALEDAIQKVEAEYTAAEATGEEPVDELEAIFASLSDQKPKTAPRPPEPAAFANRPPENPTIALPSALSGAQKPLPVAPKPASSTMAQTSAEAPRRRPPVTPDPDSFFLEPGDEDSFAGEIEAPRPRRRSGGGLLAALLVLIVIAGAAYGAWFKRGDIASALGVQLPEFARTNEPASKNVATTAKPAPAAKKADDAKTADAKPAATAPTQNGTENNKQADAAETAPPAPGTTKFTQRLAADGTETNPGPATGEAKVGEGTSVAAVAPAPGGSGAPTGEAAPAAPNADTAQIPVGQRAIFYEERTNTEQGSANTGTVVWSLVKESPGGNLPAEPAIRGEMSIPAKNLQLRITIRRNGDKTLPASHIVELIFLTPDNFEGGGIDSVLRMAMKDSEQAPGSPVIGIPAKIADGYFLLALNDGKAEIETNKTLLRRESWIDIPVVYKSGRRALVTLEKGIPGDKVFDDVLGAWEQTPIGQEQTPAAGDGDSADKPASPGGSNG
jgi:hypothetical protein